MEPNEAAGFLHLIFGIAVLVFLWAIGRILIDVRNEIRDLKDETKKSLDDLGEKLDMIEDNTDTKGRERL